MKSITTLSVGLLCLVATLVTAHDHVYKAKLEESGASCSLAEAGSSKQMTAMFMKCECKDAMGEDQTYYCQYKSEGRAAYNCKERGRTHIDFMEVLFDKITEVTDENKDGYACYYEQIEMDSGDCEGTTFTRTWEAGPSSPCVVQKKEQRPMRG